MRWIVWIVGVGLLNFSIPAVAKAGMSGVPVVIDGGTVELGGERFRLYGIDAPDLRQRCEIRGRDYDCGHVSKTALMDLVAGVEISCVPRAPVGAGMRRATCYANGYDLAEGMAHTGWAMAMPRGGGKYLRIERQAERSRRGLWQGKFIPPWDWKPD
ncbi:MAG: thermonuclease family protein [Rhodospirillales bacterium]|nr:thermonuclease family protein [Rhodospirillales bacterium]